jgi:hypothetical protein
MHSVPNQKIKIVSFPQNHALTHLPSRSQCEHVGVSLEQRNFRFLQLAQAGMSSSSAWLPLLTEILFQPVDIGNAVECKGFWQLNRTRNGQRASGYFWLRGSITCFSASAPQG